MSTFSTQADPVIELKDLSLSFKLNFGNLISWRDLFIRSFWPRKIPVNLAVQSIPIAKNLSFSLYPGERLALLGTNGSGKTSLCRLIAGIYKPTQGCIRIHGKVRAVFDTRIGTHPELTGRENARVMMRLLYPQILDLDSLLKETLEFSELGRFLDAPYKTYSNGMQARLCLSILSAKSSDLLILDEISEAADDYFRRKISHRIQKMIEDSSAVIFVSHSIDQVRSLCNRALVINQGKALYDGPVEGGITTYLSLCKKTDLSPEI